MENRSMTTEQAEKTELRPFHETIVELLRTGHNLGPCALLNLVRITKIPANHDQILDALDYVGLRDSQGLYTDLIEQARHAVAMQIENEPDTIESFFGGKT